MPNVKSKFITLEGIDGAGKSTHLKFITQILEDRGHKVITVREPGGTPNGEKIRTLLLHGDSLDKITELLLMFASRTELVNKVIKPHLSMGYTVISDRFLDASYAYQGAGRNIPLEQITLVSNLISNLPQPDLTLLFDVELSQAITRISNNGGIKDRIENEDWNFFTRVQQHYRQLLVTDAQRVKLVDTNDKIENTHKIIIAYIDQLT